MSTEELAGVEPEEVITGALAEGATPEPEPVVEENARDWETEARNMGWVPEADFRGPEGKWKDAQAFVEDGENVLPIVRSQNKRLREEIAKKDDDFAKRLAAIERTSKTAFDRQRKLHDAEMKQLAKDMRKAAADGDIEAYDEISTRRDQLDKEFAESEAKEEAPQGKSVDDEFMERNDWYNVDDDLTIYAQGVSQRLMDANPNMGRSEMFAKVEAKVKEMFPQKFGNGQQRQRKTAGNGHAAVDGGSDAPAAPSDKGNLAAKLPAEARTAGQNFVKDGLFKNLEEYAKEYFNG